MEPTFNNENSNNLWNPFPNEITLSIFSHLNVKELLITQLVCKLFKNLGRDNNLWKKLCAQEGIYHFVTDDPVNYYKFYINPPGIHWLDILNYPNKVERVCYV